MNTKTFFAVFLLAALPALPLKAQTDPVEAPTPAAKTEYSTPAATNQATPNSPNAPAPQASLSSINPYTVGLVAIITPFAFALGIFGMIFYSKHRRQKTANETLRALIEKGMPLTPELIDSLKQLQSPDEDAFDKRYNDFKAGMVLVATGLGLCWMGVNAGLVILSVGLALLVCAAIIAWSRAKSNKSSESSPKN